MSKLEGEDAAVDAVNELAFLRFFYRNAGSFMGPADSDIYDMIQDDFVSGGGTMPISYVHEEGLDDEEG